VNASSKRRRRTGSITASNVHTAALCGVFTLPDDADTEKVKAELKGGILRVHLPKSEKAKPKQIEVAVA